MWQRNCQIKDKPFIYRGGLMSIKQGEQDAQPTCRICGTYLFNPSDIKSGVHKECYDKWLFRSMLPTSHGERSKDRERNSISSVLDKTKEAEQPPYKQ